MYFIKSRKHFYFFSPPLTIVGQELMTRGSRSVRFWGKSGAHKGYVMVGEKDATHAFFTPLLRMVIGTAASNNPSLRFRLSLFSRDSFVNTCPQRPRLTSSPPSPDIVQIYECRFENLKHFHRRC